MYRIFVLLALLGCVACFVLFAVTGRPHYKRWGLIALKWTVLVVLAFFGVLIFDRIV